MCESGNCSTIMSVKNAQRYDGEYYFVITAKMLIGATKVYNAGILDYLVNIAIYKSMETDNTGRRVRRNIVGKYSPQPKVHSSEGFM